ncbi:MAG TPA: bifunctional [glutamine synthetase] adenylyltransferase/[glutamine synthetase]-adenylyl-L-tyrosine phosphorylase, partial [Rhizobiales bacterium]|nr:bifunctional [glutamine synthetase] adenylyltransferase/[glutamine synthetase]-adenylyl-L-tyrosine phosphorylase [Hyphomicrobiales bacterium]
GAAPRLAQELSRRPGMLDAVLEPTFFSHVPDCQEIKSTLSAQVPQSLAFDQVLDQCRIVGREQMFRIGVRILTDTLSAQDAAKAYSNLAQGLIERLLQAVQADLEPRYGVVAGGNVCIVAMGKLGGREMTAASDLDLIVIYDHDEDATASSGPKTLSPNQYFARLTQRLISALTAPTPEGVLYEVDMRLRPSGNKGPIATRLSSFVDYQKNSAWTWEKMALTRARVVAGDSNFGIKVDKAIADCLCAERDAQTVIDDAVKMRQTMLASKKPTSPWDLKSIPGGMVDIEFIVQVLQITNARQMPEILSQNILEAVKNLTDNSVLDLPTARQLESACRLYQQLTQILKLGIDGPFDPERSPPGLTKLINAATASPDLATSHVLLEELQLSIREIFKTILSADNSAGPSGRTS